MAAKSGARPKARAKVILYTTQSCPYCVMAKEFLKANRVGFREVDVGADNDAAGEMVKKSGQYGVPVLDIRGKVIVGFDEPEIRKALGI